MSNQKTFDEASASVLPGKQGIRHDGDLYKEAKWANKNSADLLNRFSGGIEGVRKQGDLLALLLRIEANTVVVQNLVKALANVSGGEAFDQEKLLAGIEKLLAEAVVKVEVSVEGGK